MRLPWRRGERASSLDLLVVGLGNPGREYTRNRHNVGWMIVEELARRHGASWRSKFNGRLAELRLDGHRVALLKPETYMNESGRAVAAAARFFKVDPDAILVVHDEGDFDLGRLQARMGGGVAGHNGLRSIDASLGSEFKRVRIGIGHPGPGQKEKVTPHVLGNYFKAEMEPLSDLLAAIAAEADWLANGDDARFMSEVALRLQQAE